MNVTSHAVGSATVVRFTGPLDARSAPLAHASVRDTLPIDGVVVLDLSEVSYVSSAGLRMMLMVYRQTQRSGTPVALTGLSPLLHSALSATGFLRFFWVVDDVAEALTGRTDQSPPITSKETS